MLLSIDYFLAFGKMRMLQYHMNDTLAIIQEKLALVPHKSGVYMMRDTADHIIYIGKAKDLRARLGSYFHSSSHDQKVTAMLQRVVTFDYFITKTENDALALEANLVKKHKPHYNILLKDNKTFPYIKIVDCEFPYLEVTRKIERGRGKMKSKYFGPYFNGIWARELLNTLCDIFPLRTCSKQEFARGTPCVNHQIGRCLAPCTTHHQKRERTQNNPEYFKAKQEYADVISKVKAFLRGEQNFDAHKTLTEKMENAASIEQFEIAIRYRNGLAFLDKIKERTIADTATDFNCDVFAYALRGQVFVASVLTVRAGKLIGIQNFSSENMEVETEQEMLVSFILQYYQEHIVPEDILVPCHTEALSEILDTRTSLPKIGYKKKLLDMAIANAKEYIETSIEQIKHRNDFTHGACLELGKILGMDRIPKKIECFDVSHTAGEEQVASMTVFIDGVAERKLYRRFRIKHNFGNNDFLSMQEVVKRRLARIGTIDPSFGPAPDLMVIDGGKGQLSAVLEVFKNLEKNEVLPICGSSSVANNCDLDTREMQKVQDIFVISIAEQNEEIFTQKSTTKAVTLPKRSYALRLVQRIRDEAHRLAITYHRKRRDSKK